MIKKQMSIVNRVNVLTALASRALAEHRIREYHGLLGAWTSAWIVTSGPWLAPLSDFTVRAIVRDYNSGKWSDTHGC